MHIVTHQAGKTLRKARRNKKSTMVERQKKKPLK